MRNWIDIENIHILIFRRNKTYYLPLIDGRYRHLFSYKQQKLLLNMQVYTQNGLKEERGWVVAAHISTCISFNDLRTNINRTPVDFKEIQITLDYLY